MYKMTYDGSPLLNTRLQKYTLRDVSCHLEVNDAGHLDFKIDVVHPLYNDLQNSSGVIELKLDDDVLYRGRITKMTLKSQDMSYEVETEGLLAYLNDSIAPAFKYPDDFLNNSDYQAAVIDGKVAEFILNYLIAAHNNTVTESQKIQIGNMSVSAFNNYLSVSSSGTDTTYTVIKSILSNESLKCYMLPRYESDGKVYVDFYSSYLNFGTNTQEIKCGDNLLSIADERDTANTFSLVYPIGYNNLNISSLSDGVLQGSLSDYSLENDCIIKQGSYVWSAAKRDKIGLVEKVVTLDYATDELYLRDYALSLLQQNYITRTITVTAFDKHFTQSATEAFKLGKLTHIVHKALEIDATLPLTSQDIEVLIPTNSKIKIGGVIKNASIFQ